MKKIVVLWIALVLALALTACGKTAGFDPAKYAISESGTWTDGTYTEIAEGKMGEFEVTVVIAGGVMTEITVGENEETPEKGGAVIESLPDKMIAEQTAAVDAVSGATVTSDALRKAVAKCLEAASAKH